MTTKYLQCDGGKTDYVVYVLPSFFVMPLVFNIFNGYSAGTGHLSWYFTNTKSSSSTVPKISRVILGLLLGLHHLRPTCVCVLRIERQKWVWSVH